jgi:hypothetical protein
LRQPPLRVGDEWILDRAAANGEELLILRPGVETAHFTRPAQPVRNRGVVTDAGEIVEEQCHGLAAARLTGFELL